MAEGFAGFGVEVALAFGLEEVDVGGDGEG